MNTSPGLQGYWVNDNAPRLGPPLPAIVRAAADARRSSPVAPAAVPAPPRRFAQVALPVWTSRCGQDNMTSWLRACGSVPLCLLLCCLAAPRAEASGAGEWRLIRANYIISQQLARILYLVKASLRNISSSPAQRCCLRGVWRSFTSSPLRGHHRSLSLSHVF